MLAITPTLPVWHRTPEAADLIADCAANPPREHHSTTRYGANIDHHVAYSRRDRRVARLEALRTECFDAAAIAQDQTAMEANFLTVEAAIKAEIDGLDAGRARHFRPMLTDAELAAERRAA